MKLSRAEAYESLFRIKSEKNINIDEYLVILSNSSIVPKLVYKFIEDNSSRTLEDFIQVIAKTKPFFQNICFNYSDDISTYIKAYLSLLVHLRITLDKNPELKELVLKTFNINHILEVIRINLTQGNNDKDIIDLSSELKHIFLNDSSDKEGNLNE